MYFLPAMSRVTAANPGAMALEATDIGTDRTPIRVAAADDDSPTTATLSGTTVDLLLAVWGREHGELTVTGDESVCDGWFAMPSQAFQFGTWD